MTLFKTITIAGMFYNTNTINIPINLSFQPTYFIVKHVTVTSIVDADISYENVLLLKTSLYNNDTIFHFSTSLIADDYNYESSYVNTKYNINPQTINGNYEFSLVTINNTIPEMLTELYVGVVQLALTIEFGVEKI